MYRAIVCMVLIGCFGFMSAQRISYGYDASGNQVSRTLTVEVYESATRSQVETSVKELCLDSFKVYPNPVQNELHIEIPSSALPDAVAILYDFSGQLLRRVRITETRMSIDMTDYVSGIYLLNIWTLSGEITYKIVKR